MSIDHTEVSNELKLIKRGAKSKEASHPRLTFSSVGDKINSYWVQEESNATSSSI
jgi:hypothetical protein